MKQNILITGANGYVGWNLVCRLAMLNEGKIICVDDCTKERFQREAQINTIPQNSLETKINLLKACKLNKHCELEYVWMDVTSPEQVESLFITNKFDVIIHLAQQESNRVATQNIQNALSTHISNTTSTLTLLWMTKVYCPNALFILRSSIECFGHPEICLNDNGKITFSDLKNTVRLPIPLQPTSLCDCSKAASSIYAQFAANHWKLKVVEFKQGIVYGVTTLVTKRRDFIRGCFNYDSVFGTVVNRFIAQAVCKQPLTIYGTGNQSCAIISLDDVVKSYSLVINKYIKQEYSFFGISGVGKTSNLVQGFFKSINQIAYVMKVKDIVNEISKIMIENFDTKIECKFVPHLRRKESEDEYYSIFNNVISELQPLIFRDTLHDCILDVQHIKKDIDIAQLTEVPPKLQLEV